jgi:hypothetical protein
MSDEIAYIGRNLNARTIKAVEGFQVEVSRIQREAAGAGALHGSRTFISFWQAGLAILEREMLSAMQLVYNHTGKHTGEVYDQIAYCSNQMIERMVQEVRTKANLNDQAFGGGYAEIVDRLLTAMREKRERLLDDFQHGMMGSERLKKDPVVSIVANQTDSPGAVQQIGVGDFSQNALVENHQLLVDAVNKALASPEYQKLEPAQKDALKDVADTLLDEAKKGKPDPGKLRRWGNRLVDLGKELGLHVLATEIVHIMGRMFLGGG